MAAWSGLGMNYCYQTNTDVAIDADLTYLKSYGINKLRVILPDKEDAAGITAFRNVCLRAKLQDFFVTWGITQSATTLTAANFDSAYVDAVSTQAAWAQANGIDQFSIGNELLLYVDGSLTYITLAAKLRTLATTIQAIFTNGDVVYDEVQGNGLITEWHDNGIGDLDKIGFNIYGDAGNTFEGYVTALYTNFGANVYLGEWGKSQAYSTNEDIENSYAQVIASRLEHIKNSGITDAYFYLYQTPIASNYRCKESDGTYRLRWQRLATDNGRRWLTNS